MSTLARSAALALIALTAPADGAEVRITPGSVVRFATVEEGRAALAERDAYLTNLGDLERQARLGTDQEVSEARFVEHARDQVIAWPEADVERMTAAFESARAKLARFKLDLPESILFVLTTGREEGDAAYCRGGRTIVFPRRYAETLRGAMLERILLHELFHIYSRHNAGRRAELYEVVGFRATPEIPLPEPIRARRLTNPDAPVVNCAIELPVEGGARREFAPVLYLKVERIDPADPGPFFKHLEFRLMAVEEAQGAYRPALHAGEPLLLDPAQTPAYAEATGGNTGYIIHPEEILADNFAHLVLGAEGLPSPEVVEALGKLLAP